MTTAGSPQEICACDESTALRAELAVVKAERDYLAGMADPSDLRVMRQELAKEHTDTEGTTR